MLLVVIRTDCTPDVLRPCGPWLPELLLLSVEEELLEDEEVAEEVVEEVETLRIALLDEAYVRFCQNVINVHIIPVGHTHKGRCS